MSILNSSQDHTISLADAEAMTKRYRDSSSFNGKYGGFFSKDGLLKILEQTDCAGIRYYYGLNSSEEPVLVLVGATEDNHDLYNGELAEMSTPCPSFCDTESPLRNDL
jgi:hypothetical protein